MDTDRLLARARDGDAAAFEALVSPHEQMLWRTCWRLTGSEEDARDAVQEAMLKAWRAIGGFEGRSSVSTWLYAIAVRCCRDLGRRKAARPSASLDSLQEAGWDPPSDSPGPQRALEDTERREQVRRALALIPEDQRTPLVLFAVEGKRYEEIADLTGVPVGTVKSRVSRGRDRLRELMREFGRDGNNPPPPASKQMKGGRSHDL